MGSLSCETFASEGRRSVDPGRLVVAMHLACCGRGPTFLPSLVVSAPGGYRISRQPAWRGNWWRIREWWLRREIGVMRGEARCDGRDALRYRGGERGCATMATTVPAAIVRDEWRAPLSRSGASVRFHGGSHGKPTAGPAIRVSHFCAASKDPHRASGRGFVSPTTSRRRPPPDRHAWRTPGWVPCPRTPPAPASTSTVIPSRRF